MEITSLIMENHWIVFLNSCGNPDSLTYLFATYLLQKKCCKIINFAKQPTAARALFCEFTLQSFIIGSYWYVVTTDSVDASWSGSEVIKHFSCSTQLSTKFQLLIKTKIQTNALSLSDVVFIMLINVKMPTICWHFSKCKNANNLMTF